MLYTIIYCNFIIYLIINIFINIINCIQLLHELWISDFHKRVIIDSPKWSSTKVWGSRKINRKLKKQSMYFSLSFLRKRWQKQSKTLDQVKSNLCTRIDLIALYLSLSSIFFLPQTSASRMHDPCPYPRSLSLPNYNRKPSVPRGRFQWLSI